MENFFTIIRRNLLTISPGSTITLPVSSKHRGNIPTYELFALSLTTLFWFFPMFQLYGWTHQLLVYSLAFHHTYFVRFRSLFFCIIIWWCTTIFQLKRRELHIQSWHLIWIWGDPNSADHPIRAEPGKLYHLPQILILYQQKLRNIVSFDIALWMPVNQLCKYNVKTVKKTFVENKKSLKAQEIILRKDLHHSIKIDRNSNGLLKRKHDWTHIDHN